jgi:hypothetical protein
MSAISEVFRSTDAVSRTAFELRLLIKPSNANVVNAVQSVVLLMLGKTPRLGPKPQKRVEAATERQQNDTKIKIAEAKPFHLISN